jgi:hypothetical protein
MKMEESNSVEEVFCIKPEESGDRRRGRPKLSWREESEEDVALVGCRNWRIHALSKEEWRKLIKEVKCQPGM